MFARYTVVYSWTAGPVSELQLLMISAQMLQWEENHVNTHCMKTEQWGFYEIYSRKPFGVERYYLPLFYRYGSVQSNSTEPSSYLFKKKTCNFSVARLQKRTYGRILAITCAFLSWLLALCKIPAIWLITLAEAACTIEDKPGKRDSSYISITALRKQ